MLAAVVLTILMAVLPSPQWLESGKVSEEISRIVVSDAGGGDGVLVETHEPTFSGSARNPEPLSPARLHVWLLKADGSAVRQVRPVQFLGVVTSHSADHSALLRFWFAQTSRNELRGVVVELDGKMFVREIPAKTAAGNYQCGKGPIAR